MLTELLESDAGVAVARLSSLLHVEGTDMEVVPVDVASVVKEGVYFGRCTGAVRRVRCGAQFTNRLSLSCLPPMSRVVDRFR